MHRDMGQPSLAEVLVSETLGQNQRLERIAAAVDWDRLGQVVASVHAAPRGRPSYPPLLMVKVLLLQQWSTLSDPQLEEALGDRLSFRRFVGLGAARRHARPLDHQPLSGRIGGPRAQRAVVHGGGGPTGRAGLGAEAGHAVGRHAGGGPGAPPAAGGGARRAECHRPGGGLDADGAGRPVALRLEGASGGGRRHGGGAAGGVDPRQRLRERGGRRLGERGRAGDPC